MSRALLAGVVIVLAASLSPYEFGILSVALLLSTVFIVLVDVGFAPALVFEQDEVDEAAASAMSVSIAVGATVGIGLFLTADALSAVFRAPGSAPLIRAYAGIIIVNGIVLIPLMRLNRELAFRRPFLIERVVAGSVLTILLALESVGVWSLVIGDALRCLVILVLVVGVRGRASAPLAPADGRRLWPYARGPPPHRSSTSCCSTSITCWWRDCWEPPLSGSIPLVQDRDRPLLGRHRRGDRRGVAAMTRLRENNEQLMSDSG